MSDRTLDILTILNRDRRASVSDISAELGVSQVTVRKNLNQLEESGIIKREHGYARIANTNDVKGRLAYRYEEKKLIAGKAAELVNDGDTIMVESGSCCALLVEELALNRRNVTVITNSSFLPDYVRQKGDIRFILLGGIFQGDSQTMSGPMVRTCAAQFSVGLFFIGIDGYSPESGFANNDLLRAQAVRDMACRADSTVVLSVSEKFRIKGTVPLQLDNIKTVITDTGITPEAASELERAGIELITAEIAHRQHTET